MPFHRRLTLLLVVVAVGFVLVWGRVFQLQCLSGGVWQREANDLRHPPRKVDGRRGRILDADGKVLALDSPALNLAFAADDWGRRARTRCRECGAVHCRPVDSPLPKACSCKAPREALEPIPDQDLAPLERALDLPSGTLALYAEAETKALTARVEKLVALAVERQDVDEFRENDFRKVLREDYFRRATPVRSDALKKLLAPTQALAAKGAPGAPPAAASDPPWVKKIEDLPREAIQFLELDAASRYRGFSVISTTERRYPFRQLLAHCIGWATPANKEDVARLGSSISRTTAIGRAGLEAHYDDWLRGRPGMIVDGPRGDDGEDSDSGARDTLPQKGLDLHLPFRLEACVEAQVALEHAATPEGFAAGGPASGGFIGMDPETGEILWWAETPTFDLNAGPGAGISARVDADAAARVLAWKPGDEALEGGTFTEKATPWASISRIASLPVEPGSAMKVFTALFLLESAMPPPDGALHCTGHAHGVNDKPGCHESHGVIGLAEALTVSCNRWFAWGLSRREALSLYRATYPAFGRSLGFDARTGIDMAKESAGWFRPEKEPSLRNLAIGQAMLATPLQMVRIAALVANGGRLVTPHLVRTLGDRTIEAPAKEVHLADMTLARVRAGLRGAVEVGTAAGAFREVGIPAGVTVFGKTGTAEVGGKASEWDPTKISDGPWHHWFVGYAQRAGQKPVAFAMVLHARREAAAGLTTAKGVARYLRWWFGTGAAR